MNSELQRHIYRLSAHAMDGFEQCGRGVVMINQPEAWYRTLDQVRYESGDNPTNLLRLVESYNPLAEFVVAENLRDAWLLKLPRSSFY